MVDETTHQPRRRHPDRLFEWYAASYLLAFGWLVVSAGGILTPRGFGALVGTGLTEDLLGLATAGFGGVWMAALYINGNWRRTPFLRLACAAFGAGLWSAIAFGSTGAGEAQQISTGTATYGLVALFTIIAASRIGHDIAINCSRRK